MSKYLKVVSMKELDQLRLKELISGNNLIQIKISVIGENDVEKTCLIQDENNVRKIFKTFKEIINE